MSYIWLFIKQFFVGITVFFMLMVTLISLTPDIIKFCLAANSKPKSTQE